MAEFFLELFSEEIPSNLQKNARDIFLENFKNFFTQKNIIFKKGNTYSTPNRLIISSSLLASTPKPFAYPPD